jgi:hypothetical protein
MGATHMPNPTPPAIHEPYRITRLAVLVSYALWIVIGAVLAKVF